MRRDDCFNDDLPSSYHSAHKCELPTGRKTAHIVGMTKNVLYINVVTCMPVHLFPKVSPIPHYLPVKVKGDLNEAYS